MLKKSELRKKEIQDVARTVFLEKGFAKTTMEDIIERTSLSKGGFYYYYKNTTDILYDMMVEGQRYRYNIISERIKKKGSIDIHTMASLLYEKIVDDNYLMPIYVIFLQETKRNEKIKELYNQIKDVSIDEIFKLIKVTKKINEDLLTNFINAMILSCEILNTRKNFIENKKIIINMIELILSDN